MAAPHGLATRPDRGLPGLPIAAIFVRQKNYAPEQALFREISR